MKPIPLFNERECHWADTKVIVERSYVCGFCSHKVAVNKGYSLQAPNAAKTQKGGIYLCPHCFGPTFITPTNTQIPSPAFGNSVSQVPPDLNSLYEEARNCSTSASYTAAVLLCRKMLMNIAVKQGAKEGEHFITYVDYLSEKGYVPPNGKHWVDHIRKKGNEATHEIRVMTEADAKELLTFLEMLLRFIYEFPAMVPLPAGATPSRCD